jgi:NDP-hexose-3-ketoreductase
MKPIRFGLIGCANVAKRHVLPAMKKIKSIELISVASRSQEKSREFASEFGCEVAFDYQSLLSDSRINAIYMPLPTGLHFEWAHKALDAGKHLLIEKSLSNDYSDAISIVKKAQLNNLLVTENYMFEHHAQQSEVRKLIIDRVGNVRLFRASFGFPPLEKNNFRYDYGLGGGALLDAGGYTLKALEVFFPGSVARVMAARLEKSGDVDIFGTAMLNVESNLGEFPAIISFGFDNHYQCNIEVWGSRGLIKTNRTFTAGLNFAPTIEIEDSSGVEKFSLSKDDHFYKMLLSFSENIINGQFNHSYDSILKQAKLQQDIINTSIK